MYGFSPFWIGLVGLGAALAVVEIWALCRVAALDARRCDEARSLESDLCESGDQEVAAVYTTYPRAVK